MNHSGAAFFLALVLALFPGLFLGSCLGIDTAPYQDKPGFPGSAQSGRFEAEMLKAANKERASQGFKPLQWDEALAELARAHATDLAKRGAVDHAGFETRYKLSGYRLCVENVAQTQGDAAVVVDLWMNSPGHKANLLHPEVNRVGIGRVGPYVAYMSCR